MNPPAHRPRITILLLLAAVLILQKGLELRSRLLPEGTPFRLADGTLMLANPLAPESPDARERITAGDVLLLIEWRVIRDTPSFLDSWERLQQRLKIPMLVHRGSRNVGIQVEPRKLVVFAHPGEQAIVESATYIFVFLSAFLALGAGAYVLGARPERSASRLFMALAATFSFSAGEMPLGASVSAALFSGSLMITARAVLPAILTHFFLVYPRPLPVPGRKTLLALLYLLAVPGLALRLLDHLAQWLGFMPTPWGFFWLPFTVFHTVLCFVLAGVVAAYWMLQGSRDQARRLRWMALAAAAGLIFPVLVSRVLPEFLAFPGEIGALVNFMVAPWPIIFPLMFSYPLVKYRVVNLRWLMRELALAVVAAWPLRFLLVLPVAFVMRSALASGTIGIGHLLAIGIVVTAAGWIRGISEEAIDRALFPAILKLKKGLEELASRAIACPPPESPEQLIAAELPRLTGCGRCLVFRQREVGRDFVLQADSGGAEPLFTLPPAVPAVRPDASLMALIQRTPRALTLAYERPSDLGNLLPSSERELMSGLGIALVVPMREGEITRGLLALGEKSDQEAYSETEQEWLYRLASIAEKRLAPPEATPAAT